MEELGSIKDPGGDYRRVLFEAVSP